MNSQPLGMVGPEREAELLREIIDTISRPSSLESLSARVAQLITTTTDTDVCFVHVLDDNGRSLALMGATPPFDEHVGRIRLKLGDGVAGWVAAHCEPAVIAQEKEKDPRYRYIPALRGTEFTSMASVPMMSEHAGLVGVLNVHTVARREFTSRDVRLLSSIGSLVAGAMHRELLHRQLSAKEHAHERFAEQVIAAQESERQRLARDIHDGISQRLVSLSYHLDATKQALNADPAFADDQLSVARELVDATLDETRSAISGLRPPVLDDLGLTGGLASIARSFANIHIGLAVSERRLPEHLEVALYRITQEALQNVAKHSGADAASVSFRCSDTKARLEIRDNGCGFDTELASFNDDPTSSYGLTSIAERAELVGGELHITSALGKGTVVTVSVPLPPDTADHRACDHHT